MASERHRYPDNWKELAFAVKEAANWQCQKCGLLCIKPGEILFQKFLSITMRKVSTVTELRVPKKSLKAI